MNNILIVEDEHLIARLIEMTPVSYTHLMQT